MQIKVDEKQLAPRIGSPYNFPPGTLSRSTLLGNVYFLTVDGSPSAARKTEVINLGTGRIAPQAGEAVVLQAGSTVLLTQ